MVLEISWPIFSICSELLLILSSFQPKLFPTFSYFCSADFALAFLTIIAALPELNVTQVCVTIFVQSQVPLLNFLAGYKVHSKQQM